MRRILSILALLIVGQGAALRAQEQTVTRSAGAEVAVHIVDALVLNVYGATYFGTVHNHLRGATVDPVNPTGTTSTAAFQVSGYADSDITVDFPAGLTLYNSTQNSIPFTTNLTGHPDAIQSASTPVVSGSTRKLNSSGQHSFFLGGNISIAPEQPTGYYTGMFTMTVAYPSL